MSKDETMTQLAAALMAALVGSLMAIEVTRAHIGEAHRADAIAGWSVPSGLALIAVVLVAGGVYWLTK